MNEIMPFCPGGEEGEEHHPEADGTGRGSC